jgi:hypothetical protein
VKIGWEFISWTGQPVKCAVSSCNAMIYSGHVRVDRTNPQHGDPVLCTDCHFHIMAGIDPDPQAVTPEWEQENRAKRLEAFVNGEEA